MNQRQVSEITQDFQQHQSAKVAKSVSPSSAPDNPVLQAQGIIGNHGVLRQHGSPVIQAKLKIGEPNDVYEQEADRVADAVMRMPDPQIQRKEDDEDDKIQMKPVGEQITPLVQRKGDTEHRDEDDEDEPIQMKPDSERITPLVQRKGDTEHRDEDDEDEHIQKKPAAGETSPLVQRKGETEHRDEDDEDEPIQMKGEVGGNAGLNPKLESGIRSMKGGGEPLSKSDRDFFEPRFGYDFRAVRVHKESKSAESAKAMDAIAFTVGNDIFFDKNHYLPDTIQGRMLIAHELAHTIQQGKNRTTQIATNGFVQRKPVKQPKPDQQIEDPNYLLCLALCYIGLPPDLWKVIVSNIFQAVFEEYKFQYGEIKGSDAYEEARYFFASWGLFTKLKFIVCFLGESMIGPITINSTKAQALRTSLLSILKKAGIREATFITASQIIRKVAFAIEIAWVSGCALYCGASELAKAIIIFSKQMSDAVIQIAKTGRQIAKVGKKALTNLISFPVLVAYYKMDPLNWDLSAFPERSRRHLSIIGHAFRLVFSADDFITHMTRPLKTYKINDIITDLSIDINALLNKKGYNQTIKFTPTFIGELKPIEFINILKDYNLISFYKSPESLANKQLTGEK